MDANLLTSILKIAGIISLGVLIWLFIEFIRTLRKSTKLMTNVSEQIEPTLKNVEELTESAKPLIADANAAIKNIEEITETIKPTMAKVDPLVDRVGLTIDAANLEIMRVDQILENVGEITTTANGAVDTLNSAVQAPVDFVTNISGKVGKVLGTKNASKESAALGSQKEKKDVQARIGASSQNNSQTSEH